MKSRLLLKNIPNPTWKAEAKQIHMFMVFMSTLWNSLFVNEGLAIFLVSVLCILSSMPVFFTSWRALQPAICRLEVLMLSFSALGLVLMASCNIWGTTTYTSSPPPIWAFSRARIYFIESVDDGAGPRGAAYGVYCVYALGLFGCTICGAFVVMLTGAGSWYVLWVSFPQTQTHWDTCLGCNPRCKARAKEPRAQL